MSVTGQATALAMELSAVLAKMDGAAMDILSDGKGDNTTYVLTGTTLHTVDLTTGTPTTLGDVSGLPSDIIDIAATNGM